MQVFTARYVLNKDVIIFETLLP